MSKVKFKSKHKHKYYIWCAGCGHEDTCRVRLKKCSKCNTVLHEKRYLM